MSYLLCIETANPGTPQLQSDFADFYISTLTENAEDISRKINVIAKKTGIHQRYSVIRDYSLSPPEYSFFGKNKSLEPMPGLSERMALYKKEALPLSLNAVYKINGLEKIKSRISHVITVTCTGLFAPGLEIELVRALNLPPDTNRMGINFMGCNAAVLALKQADQICKGKKDAIVLIVCTEICSIHFQKSYTDDYIMSNFLFADGSAAVIVSAENIRMDDTYTPVHLKSFQSLLVHEGFNDMAWQLSETGFMMNLTSYVSGLLNKNISVLLQQSGIHANDIDHWAIHPGGKKILDDFCASMNVDKECLSHSYSVMKNYGNMSSPTILFVLNELLQSGEVKEKESIYAAAFGPGLSIESVLLEHV